MVDDGYRHEIDLLYEVSNQLTHATTPEELLDALSLHARAMGAFTTLLYYILSDDAGMPAFLEAVAVWSAEGQPFIQRGTRVTLEQVGMNPLYETSYSRPIFVENTATSGYLPERAQAVYSASNTGSAITLLLVNKSRWVGGVSLHWRQPRTFPDWERRIYTALSQLAAPMIDSIRLIEQTSRRASQLEAAKNEIDLLHRASSQLTLATSPSEQLEAVSAYARSQGAVQGFLTAVDQAESDLPEWSEVIAEWTTDPIHTFPVGMRFQTVLLPLMDTPGQPIFIEDVQEFNHVSPALRKFSAQRAIHASAVLPLKVTGRWIGILCFNWNRPYVFDVQDERIYTALIQQAAPVIDSVRLLDQTRRRAHELEIINREIAMLYQATARLAHARSPEDLLEAVSDYPRQTGATTGDLAYIVGDETGPDGWREVVAEWVLPGGVSQGGVGARFPNTAFSSITDWLPGKDTAWLISDIRSEPGLDATSREHSLKTEISSMAILPLPNQGRLVGMLFFFWKSPYTFAERDQRIYTALIQQTAPVVDSVRLLEDNSRRAQRAEEAYRESDVLYRASTAINAARSFADIVAAVEDFDPGAHGIALSIWENYDFESATCYEVVATGRREDPRRVGLRYPKNEFPITALMPREVPIYIENVQTDSRVDTRSRESWQQRGVKAGIGVPLTLNNRWMGILAFHSDQPRQYNSFEKRLVAGIGALVSAAVERIRLQTMSETSRRRAEMLAQISSALSQTTDEQSILAAIEPLSHMFRVALSILAYSNTDEYGRVVEVKTAALRSPLTGPIAVQDFPLSIFGLEDFPFLQLAYDKPDAPVFIDNTHSQMPGSEPPAEWPAVIVIPLKTGEKWQGVLMFLWAEPQTFDREICRMVTALQPSVASIVATRRAYTAEQQRARELETVAKVSAAVVSILDVDQLLNAIAEVTRASFRDYSSVIYLLDDAGVELIQTTAGRVIPPAARTIRLDCERSLIAQAGRTRQGIIVNNIAASPDFDLAPLLTRAQSEMAVPMVVGNRLIGVLDIQSQEVNRFSEADIWVMGTLADLIAVAVQNARLYARAQAVAALEERNRLARELHDSVSQALYGIALGARTARKLLDRDPARLVEPLDYVLSLADAGLTEMRALIFELRPESLENEGLAAALTKQAASIQARHGIQVMTQLDDEPAISLDMKEALYRIARESLHNTVKHAHASQITLTLRCLKDCVTLDIKDNGVGFDPQADFPGHLGLKSMQERAARLQGTWSIQSAPQQGTHIRVCLPLQDS